MRKFDVKSTFSPARIIARSVSGQKLEKREKGF